jgi:hypothetical protein
MSKETLVRLSALAAIAGGALRVADGLLVPSASAQVQQFAYFTTDLLLLWGLCGIYLTRSHRLGIAGFTGFVVFWIGIFMVRSSTLSLFGYSAYLIGATVTLLGAVALGADLLLHDVFPRWAPALWIAALILGMLGLRPAWAGWSVTLAGVIFGLGFIAAGISLLRERTSSNV